MITNHLIIPNFHDVDSLINDKVNKVDLPLEKMVKMHIIYDLQKLNWEFKLPSKKNQYPTLIPPLYYDKAIIKETMSFKRNDIIAENRKWIDKNIDFARKNITNGYYALKSKIEPYIEVCETDKQHKLFRLLRYYWSSPYSDYVGRRIKLIIRDAGLPNHPVIGIAALGSPIIHIPERDEWIGWDKTTRTKNLINTLDAYVIGALPPYNHLLGGKLVSYILASNEVRKIYRDKYKDQVTLKEQRVSNSLVGIFTTSLYGRSSQYNRMKYKDDLLYIPIGQTKGYGSLHLSKDTIQLMISLLKSHNIHVGHEFGDGPSWVMRVIRTAGDILGFDSDFLLKHSFKRQIYFVPLAKNYREVLLSQHKNPKFFNYPLKELVQFWKHRWFKNRITNTDIINNVLDFEPENFSI